MDEQLSIEDRWDEVEYIPIQVTNPRNKRRVLVSAEVVTVDSHYTMGSNYFFIAAIGRNPSKTLGLDTYFRNEADGVEWDYVLPVSFSGITVFGRVLTYSKDFDARVYLPFLDQIPASVNLDMYRGLDAVKSSVFISYSRRDRRFARSLAEWLRVHNIAVWIDESGLSIGDSVIESLRRAIDSVQYVIAIISRESVKSKWVQKELDVAMTQEIESKRTIVLPILKDECDLPGFLKGKLFADCRKQHRRRDEIAKLIRAVLNCQSSGMS